MFELCITTMFYLQSSICAIFPRYLRVSLFKRDLNCQIQIFLIKFNLMSKCFIHSYNHVVSIKWNNIDITFYIFTVTNAKTKWNCFKTEKIWTFFWFCFPLHKFWQHYNNKNLFLSVCHLKSAKLVLVLSEKFANWSHIIFIHVE